MVARSRRKSRRWIRCVILLLIAACDPGSGLYSRTSDPMLVLILSPPGSLRLTTAVPGIWDYPLTAVLATTGVPTYVEYVRADSFDTFRVADDTRFDWTEVEPPVPPGGGLPFRPTSGNYLLADSATSRGLGRADLRPGEAYRLFVRYAGHTIEGITRIPDPPQPRLVTTPEGLRVVWPRVPGVPLYLVFGATVEPASPLMGQRLTVDTVAIPILIGDLPSSVYVVALDSNYARYLTDTLITRSGLEGAHGVFGATNSGVVVVR